MSTLKPSSDTSSAAAAAATAAAASEMWISLSRRIYSARTNDQQENLVTIEKLFAEEQLSQAFITGRSVASAEDRERLTHLLEQCPNFPLILSFMITNKLYLLAPEVPWTLPMKDWSLKHCRGVGKSMSAFLIDARTAHVALSAWRLHYCQIEHLFFIEGFENFMLVIVNNLLRDHAYGMVFRVSIGALLSTVDGVTDLYVIGTYFSAESLAGQATSLLVMISANVFIQLIITLLQYKKKSWWVVLREVLITLFFLRPAVDAFRVSTNHKDSEAAFDPLTEMMANKVRLETYVDNTPKHSC